VSRCQDAIQSMTLASFINTVPPKPAGGGRTSPVVPQSPVGVLDAGCVSYKTDDDAAAAAAAVTVASHGSASSSSVSSVTSKRRKISS
jgi:cyclin D1/2/4, plant